MENIKKYDLELYECLELELTREKNTLELIASENFTSENVLNIVGSILTNKYAEGYPGQRYYGGCEVVDKVENIARERLRKLFDCRYANVQPHSGSQANMAVYLTMLNPGDKVLGLDLAHGGHLTHGSKVNFSGQFYNFVSYGLDKNTGRVNFDNVLKIAKDHKPKLIICGGSAYPRYVEFEKFREIADTVGAYLMADIAHPSGLIASGVHPSPWPFCHVATSTTHKTLRGPRGGIIMAGEDFQNTWGITAPKSGRVKMISELLDKSVMPGIQGGPLMHSIAGKAIAFKEALEPTFKIYCENIVKNSKFLAEEMKIKGYDLVSGGTDTHLVLIDLSNKNITGKLAEKKLEEAGITANKNMVPFDEKSPLVTSGIRIGTPAVTTRGMGIEEMKKIANFIDSVLSNINDEQNIKKVKSSVKELCSSFSLYSTI